MCVAILRPADFRRRFPEGQRGLSLVELIVAIVIISVGLAGVLSAFNVSVRGSADPLIAKQSLAIAEALMEEIQQAPFTFCDPDDPAAEKASSVADCAIPEALGREAGELLRPFDNVNDYNGFNLPSPPGITDVAGVAVPSLGGYSAIVAVTVVALNGITLASGDALLITVSVTAPTGAVFTLDGYRTRYAPNAVP